MTLEAIFIVTVVFILGYAAARVVDAFKDDDWSKDHRDYDDREL